jgi:adenosylhomocysteine nucleosidase
MLRRFHPLLIVALLLLCRSTNAAEPAPVTAVVGAFGPEISLLEQKLQDAGTRTVHGLKFATGTIAGRRVVLVRTGVGKVNAAMTTTLTIDRFDPAELIFTGIAGGVNPALHPGDIVLAEQTAQHDLGTITTEGMRRKGVDSPIDGTPNPIYLPADARLLAMAKRAADRAQFRSVETVQGVNPPQVVQGTVVTGDVFVASEEKSAELREAMGADAVEMEGAAVAQVCRQLGTPCLVVRGISDMADSEASKDLKTFYKISAHNGATLVVAMLTEMQKNTKGEEHAGPES